MDQDMEQVQQRATMIITGLKDLLHEERLKELGLFCLDKSRLKGTYLCVHMEVGNEEDRDILFSMVPSDSARVTDFLENPSKYKHRKFHLNTIPPFFLL